MFGKKFPKSPKPINQAYCGQKLSECIKKIKKNNNNNNTYRRLLLKELFHLLRKSWKCLITLRKNGNIYSLRIFVNFFYKVLLKIFKNFINKS